MADKVTPEILLRAYALGVFPMAEHRDDPELFWVDPNRRGIFDLDKFHISRSLARRLRREDYEIAVNRDFTAVLDACADRADTWISAEIHGLYRALHDLGHAHSLEVWIGGQLAGGVYGVTLGGAFFGESMFSHQRDGSKIALAYLVERLRRAGFTLFDTQFITPHLTTLGAVEISRAAYHSRLNAALKISPDFESAPPARLQDVLQPRTQTS